MIDYIQIFGERNSGTNYLKEFLSKNLINKIDIGYKYGWKHGFVNFKRLEKESLENVLFLVITKNPYAWLLSMNKKPHHAPQLYFKPFSQFIREEWVCYKGKQYQIRAKNLKSHPITALDQEMMQERDPSTGKRFENVIQLRNKKNLYFIRIQNEISNVHYIDYESLLLSPNDFTLSLHNKFGLKFRDKLIIPKGYYGKDPKKNFSKLPFYKNQEYLKMIPIEDYKFINSELEFKLETILGYKMIKGVTK